MMNEFKTWINMVVYFYVLFPFFAGWGWMLLAGVLHPLFGFPLFGFWVSVGMMALISWLIGSFQLRLFVGALANESLLNS